MPNENSKKSNKPKQLKELYFNSRFRDMVDSAHVSRLPFIDDFLFKHEGKVKCFFSPSLSGRTSLISMVESCVNSGKRQLEAAGFWREERYPVLRFSFRTMFYNYPGDVLEHELHEIKYWHPEVPFDTKHIKDLLQNKTPADALSYLINITQQYYQKPVIILIDSASKPFNQHDDPTDKEASSIEAFFKSFCSVIPDNDKVKNCAIFGINNIAHLLFEKHPEVKHFDTLIPNPFRKYLAISEEEATELVKQAYSVEDTVPIVEQLKKSSTLFTENGKSYLHARFAMHHLSELSYKTSLNDNPNQSSYLYSDYANNGCDMIEQLFKKSPKDNTVLQEFGRIINRSAEPYLIRFSADVDPDYSLSSIASICRSFISGGVFKAEKADDTDYYRISPANDLIGKMLSRRFKGLLEKYTLLTQTPRVSLGDLDGRQTLIHHEFIHTLLSAQGTIKLIHQPPGSGKSTQLSILYDALSNRNSPLHQYYPDAPECRVIMFNLGLMSVSADNCEDFLHLVFKNVLKRLLEQGHLNQEDSALLNELLSNAHNNYQQLWNSLIEKLSSNMPSEMSLIVLVDEYDFNLNYDNDIHVKNQIKNSISAFLAPLTTQPRVNQMILFGVMNHSASIFSNTLLNPKPGDQPSLHIYDRRNDKQLQHFFGINAEALEPLFYQIANVTDYKYQYKCKKWLTIEKGKENTFCHTAATFRYLFEVARDPSCMHPYHGCMENYGIQIKKLFDGLSPWDKLKVLSVFRDSFMTKQLTAIVNLPPALNESLEPFEVDHYWLSLVHLGILNAEKKGTEWSLSLANKHASKAVIAFVEVAQKKEAKVSEVGIFAVATRAEEEVRARNHESHSSEAGSTPLRTSQN